MLTPGYVLCAVGSGLVATAALLPAYVVLEAVCKMARRWK
jgi:hypothetical protein